MNSGGGLSADGGQCQSMKVTPTCLQWNRHTRYGAIIAQNTGFYICQQAQLSNQRMKGIVVPLSEQLHLGMDLKK